MWWLRTLNHSQPAFFGLFLLFVVWFGWQFWSTPSWGLRAFWVVLMLVAVVHAGLARPNWLRDKRSRTFTYIPRPRRRPR